MVKKRVKFDITAQDRTQAAFARIKANVDGLSRSVSMAKGLMGAAFAMAGVRALKQFAIEAINAGDAVAKTSRNLGLTGEQLQNLRHGAELAGTGVATLESSMTAFVKRVGEVKAGMGPLVSGLKTLDGELLRQIQTSRNQREALGFVAAAMKNAKTAADRARIANAAFSRAGISMIEMLRGGRDSLAGVAAEASNLGIVLEDKFTAKAEELNNTLAGLETQISVNMTRAFIGMGDALVYVTRKSAEASRGLASLSTVFAEVGNRPTESLKEMHSMALKSLGVFEKLRKKSYNGSGLADFLDESIRRQYGVLNDIERELIDRTVSTTIPNIQPANVNYGKQQDAQVKSYLAHKRWLGQLATEGKRITANVNPQSRYNARIERLKVLLDNTAISQSVYTQEVIKAQDAMERQGETAKKTGEIIGFSFEDGFQTASDALERFIGAGEFNLKSFARLALNIFGDIIRQQNMVGRGQKSDGGIGDLLGSLFSFGGGDGSAGGIRAPRKREHGGPVRAGQQYIVGEKRPELFVPNRSGTIIPQVARSGNTYYINAPGADAAGLARLQSMIRALHGSIEHRSVAAVVDASQRDPRLLAPGA